MDRIQLLPVEVILGPGRKNIVNWESSWEPLFLKNQNIYLSQQRTQQTKITAYGDSAAQG